ncbi:hypothetical protein TNCV_1904781 [Trichonephila clavipes]|nr:hypothetical protein TNCV_1904781 [Trichonephila clavipes]
MDGAGAFFNSFNLKLPPSAWSDNFDELEFECKQLIDAFLSTGRKVVLHWISTHCGIHGNEQADKLGKEAWMLHPPCLLIRLRNTDFSGINFVRKEYPLLQSWLLLNLGLLYSMAKDVLNFLSYLGWREWHVLESSLNRAGLSV